MLKKRENLGILTTICAKINLITIKSKRIRGEKHTHTHSHRPIQRLKKKKKKLGITNNSFLINQFKKPKKSNKFEGIKLIIKAKSKTKKNKENYQKRKE